MLKGPHLGGQAARGYVDLGKMVINIFKLQLTMHCCYSYGCMESKIWFIGTAGWECVRSCPGHWVYAD